ncbi:MAG: glycoside hydrolase family 16 protein, partial [Bacteroidota bacterium]
ADGMIGADGDDVEQQLDFPMPAQGQWVSLDIPLSDFDMLTTRSNLAQYILVGQPTGTTTVYVDNMFFYNADGGGGGGDAPTMAAPTPTLAAEDVISLFSDAYTDVAIDTWRTGWSSAEFEDVMVDGNATKKYSVLDFVGIESLANTVDASGMTHIHLDIWSPDFTQFGIKLVDTGADNTIGTGDDVEQQVDFPMPTQGQWVSLDIPLSDFTALTTRANLGQYILVGQPTGTTTLFVDNIYFHK